jgi:hypothetical protein
MIALSPRPEAGLAPRPWAPPSSVRFDWTMTVLCLAFVGGVYLDAWAHTHGFSDKTFYTPWHAVLYSTYVVVALFLLATMTRNVARGADWRRALPPGYGLSMVGVAMWVVGGPADLFWHQVMGIEANFDALLSPPHLVLTAGLGLIFTGPLRAAWRRPVPPRSLVEHLPMLLSLSYLLSLLTFMVYFAHPLAYLWAKASRAPLPHETGQAELGCVGTLLTAVLFMGVLFIALRRQPLPVGAVSVVVGVNSLGMGFLCGFEGGGYPWPQVAGFLVGCAVADGLLAALRPGPRRPFATHLFAIGTPIAITGGYFASLLMTGGIWWSVHLWTGTMLTTGGAGWLLSYLAMSPVPPDERETP